MRELTLRQIEVIRAVMIAGTIQGAADLLNVSAPGISRLLKHAEGGLGVRLFERKAGIFVPAAEAQTIFEMLNLVYRQMESLNAAVSSLQKGHDFALSIASAPSIANFVAVRVIRTIRQRFPDLRVELNILKIEETLDYLLLEHGEVVIMSSPVDNPAVRNKPLARGRLLAIVPEGHPLAALEKVSVHDLARYPFIGVDPGDPYGSTLAQPFRDAGIDLRHTVRGRFSQTILGLVQQGLGVALVDEFSVGTANIPGIVRRPLQEPAMITPYAIHKRGRQLSSFAEFTIKCFQNELAAATARQIWDPAGPPG